MGKAGVKIILGIDPGTNTTGYGVIEVRGSVVRCVILGVIDLHQVLATKGVNNDLPLVRWY